LGAQASEVHLPAEGRDDLVDRRDQTVGAGSSGLVEGSQVVLGFGAPGFGGRAQPLPRLAVALGVYVNESHLSSTIGTNRKSILGLLPPPNDGWSDITEFYGVPPVGTVIFIRTCQHIDSSTDVAKVTNASVPAPTP
jgi:hypothetical protein